MQGWLNRYTLIAKRWAWIVLLGVVICGSTTYVITKLMHPVYQATALLVLTTTASQSTYDNTTAVLEALPTYAQFISNAEILQPVASQHHLTAKQLSAMITVKPQSNTQIIELDVESNDPRLAAQLANEIGDSFGQYTNTQLNGVMQVKILPAQPPTDPVRPKPSLDALIGALVGLGLALAIIVVFEWTDDRMTRSEEVQELLQTETLTTIPELSAKERLKNAEETPALAEGCRILCANLNRAQAEHAFKLVMVTSALAGEGKSTIVANLASFLAMTGKRVLLVDADLRHPVLDQHFQLDNHQGLSNAFLEMWAHIEVELEGQPTEIPSLRVLTAGVLPSNPSELLQSQLAQQLFKHLKNSQQFDYIIFDTPPLLPIADAQIVASNVEAAILVVDASKTSRKTLVRVKHVLARTGVRVLGVALNKSQWLDYNATREYLGSIQQQRPRADISISTPPIEGTETKPLSNGKVEEDTSITIGLRTPKQPKD
ncbi:MAG: polysaccharide biosynthesis tyrosine autokinase [Ktedonobacteraceae bacterium]